MSIRKNSPAKKPPERELVLTRIFNAPPTLVFKAWTERKHLLQWWGPHGFTNSECAVDLRIGGKFRIVMRGPLPGMEYPMDAVFREIEEPNRLVFSFVATDSEGKALLEGVTSATFAKYGKKTKFTLRTRGVGIAPIAVQMLKGMDIGWSQSLERLAEFLKELTT